jgi:iron complex transport system substrate-binding protein
MKVVDQIGNVLFFNSTPHRIISLVPSITELFCYLGGESKLIGRTKFCIHPMPFIRTIERIGGTKNIRIPDILQLKPDLVLCNKEENDESQVKFLQEVGLNCYVSDIKTMEDFRQFTGDLAQIMNWQNQSEQFLTDLDMAFKDFPLKHMSTCLYLIWRDPYMVAGSGTFINELLTLAGFKNLMNERNRYPELSLKEIADLNPGFILLSSEPYPFKQKHVDELIQFSPKSKIVLVDGEMFSWYGNRLLQASSYFKNLQEQKLMLSNPNQTDS